MNKNPQDKMQNRPKSDAPGSTKQPAPLRAVPEQTKQNASKDDDASLRREHKK